MALQLRDDVRAFLEKPIDAVLATIAADGVPQQTVLWYYLDAENDAVVMNTAAGRIKERNLKRDPRASVCIVAGGQAVTFRGTVELNYDQTIALDDIVKLAIRYGEPVTKAEEVKATFGKDQRVILRLKVEHVIPQGFR